MRGYRQQPSVVRPCRPDFTACLAGRRCSKARLRQGEGDDLSILFESRFPALNRSQFPALKVLTNLQPKDCFGRLIEKYREPFRIACDGTDQGKLRTLGLLWLGQGDHFWSRDGCAGTRWRPSRR